MPPVRRGDRECKHCAATVTDADKRPCGCRDVCRHCYCPHICQGCMDPNPTVTLPCKCVMCAECADCDAEVPNGCHEQCHMCFCMQGHGFLFHGVNDPFTKIGDTDFDEREVLPHEWYQPLCDDCYVDLTRRVITYDDCGHRSFLHGFVNGESTCPWCAEFDLDALEEKEGKCSVCLADKHVVALPCNDKAEHTGCKDCLREWFKTGGHTCPLCKGRRNGLVVISKAQ